MRSFVLRFGLLLAASYGLLYFSHKFYDPLQVHHSDYLDWYYRMYQAPLDFTVANAPFVYRQISAIVTHALFVAGVNYPNDVAFSDPGVRWSHLLRGACDKLSRTGFGGDARRRSDQAGDWWFCLSAPGRPVLHPFVSFADRGHHRLDGGRNLAFLRDPVSAVCARAARGLCNSLGAFDLPARNASVAFGLIAAFSFLIGLGTRRYTCLCSSLRSCVSGRMS